MKRRVLALRPTQFAIGMREVDRKTAKFRALGRKKLKAYLRRHPLPVVVGPGGVEHVVDGHHHLRACWEAGHRRVFIDVKADYSRLSSADFWVAMRKSSWTHLYDEFGGGPHRPQRLPEDIRGAADDAYRSLAWAVRRAGGFKKSAMLYAEFKWADFFRENLLIGHGVEAFDRAVKEGLRLCRSRESRRLPGAER